MATYKGHDIVQKDNLDEDRKLLGKRLPGTTIDEEAWELPEEAGTERTRRPGEKGYRQEMNFAKGGKVLNTKFYRKGSK